MCQSLGQRLLLTTNEVREKVMISVMFVCLQVGAEVGPSLIPGQAGRRLILAPASSLGQTGKKPYASTSIRPGR